MKEEPLDIFIIRATKIFCLDYVIRISMWEIEWNGMVLNTV